MNVMDSQRIETFRALGRTCPICGQQPELQAAFDIDTPYTGSITWHCHRTITAALEVGNTNRDELELIAAVVREQKEPEALPDKPLKLIIYRQPEEANA